MASASASGNVLFLILIAVALFAALSYAVTSTTGGAPKGAADEQARLGASRLLGYGADMQARFDRMRISNSIQPNEFYVENDVYQVMNGTRKFCCLSGVARPDIGLFHPSGGGLIPQTFETLTKACASGCTPAVATKHGHLAMVWTRGVGIGTSSSDLTARIVGLTNEVCTEINRRVGISGIPLLSIPALDYVRGDPYPSATAPTGGAAMLKAVYGKHDFCYETDDGTGRNIYTHILVER